MNDGDTFVFSIYNKALSGKQRKKTDFSITFTSFPDKGK